MIHIIIGTRAQLIKMAPIMVELNDRKIKYNFIFLEEHKDTIASMLKMFKLRPPDIIIGKNETDITSEGGFIIWSVKVMLYAIKHKNRIFKNDKAGIVLVHGDAPPALLGSMMAKLQGLNVGHIEAGLRSHDILNPFPEEIIRRITSRLTNYHFVSDKTALDNLRNISGIKMNIGSNTLFDSLTLASRSFQKITAIIKNKYCVVSIHRFENLNSKTRLNFIINVVSDISKKYKVVFVLHPVTEKKLSESNLLTILRKNNNIILRNRYNYFDFIQLLKGSEFLISDGGSNQEECSYLGIPCLLMRDKSERSEGLSRNAVLSRFNLKIVIDFVKSYKNYRKRLASIATSPSKLIIDTIYKYI